MTTAGFSGDWWRQVKRVVRDFANSRAGQMISEASLREFLRHALPALWDKIKEYSHEIFMWFLQIAGS